MASKEAKKVADHLFKDAGVNVEYSRLVLSKAGEDKGRSGWSKPVVVDVINDAITKAVKAERERCAKIAEAYLSDERNGVKNNPDPSCVAAAIRKQETPA